jgi:hypothetical protein
MLTPQQFVVNRFPAAKFLSNTNAQGAGFADGGDVSGKSKSKNSETGESQNRKPDPGFGSRRTSAALHLRRHNPGWKC